MNERVDLLLLSLGTTRGLRAADAAFADLVRRAGASVETVTVEIGASGRLRRAYPVTDLVEALAARRALSAALRREDPRAVAVSTTTAALLMPAPTRPYTVRLDAPAALNRPGVRNAPLHLLERRRLSRATLILPTGRAAAAALPRGSAPHVVVPPPVAPSGEPGERTDLAAAYTPDPKAKGLDVLCAAWARAGVEGVRLAVFGIDPDRGRAFLARRGVPEPPGVEWRGHVAPAEFRAALRSSRAFVTAARWEDHGLAQLEALADGALLVCAPAGGPFEALDLARTLDERLVAPDVSPDALAACIREAFRADPERDRVYRRDAATLLAPYRPEAVLETVAGRVLPALLDGPRA